VGVERSGEFAGDLVDDSVPDQGAVDTDVGDAQLDFSATNLSPAELFEAYADDLVRYVRRRVHANDVEDLVAETFVVACRRLSTIPRESELAWLYRTAWNVVSNHWRRQTPIAVEHVPETRSDDFAHLVTESAALQQAWRALSARDREVLRLVAWEGLNGAGLAEALGISVSGAGAALWRARQHFEQVYAAVSHDDGGDSV
jgi:RNA polymerase sigma-70 factor (ECF subfamily)